MFEQKETASGYIQYVHTTTGETQNDHPKLLEMLHVIRNQHKSIKYITYRSATKLWFLKQTFYSKNSRMYTFPLQNLHISIGK